MMGDYNVSKEDVKELFRNLRKKWLSLDPVSLQGVGAPTTLTVFALPPVCAANLLLTSPKSERKFCKRDFSHEKYQLYNPCCALHQHQCLNTEWEVRDIGRMSSRSLSFSSRVKISSRSVAERHVCRVPQQSPHTPTVSSCLETLSLWRVVWSLSVCVDVVSSWEGRCRGDEADSNMRALLLQQCSSLSCVYSIFLTWNVDVRWEIKSCVRTLNSPSFITTLPCRCSSSFKLHYVV